MRDGGPRRIRLLAEGANVRRPCVRPHPDPQLVPKRGSARNALINKLRCDVEPSGGTFFLSRNLGKLQIVL